MSRGARSAWRAAQVAESIAPDAGRCRSFWKAATVFSRLVPKLPSIWPQEKCARASRIWARITAEPLAPTRISAWLVLLISLGSAVRGSFFPGPAARVHAITIPRLTQHFTSGGVHAVCQPAAIGKWIAGQTGHQPASPARCRVGPDASVNNWPATL